MLGNEIPGWTIEPDHAATIHISPGPYLTISGNYSLNTDGEGYDGNNANLYQDFATQAGTNYYFSFNWQSWGIFGDDAPETQLEISLTDDATGNTLFDGFYSYDGPEEPGSNGPRHLVTTNFQAAGNLTRLRIQQSPQSGTNDNMFVVDNFNVFSSGSLQVMLGPPCAVTNGAQWQLDGGAWQNSGAVVTNLSLDSSHTISFSDVAGYTTPSNQVVVISNTGGTNCILDVSATIAALTIGGCDGTADTLNLDGNTLTVDGPITISNNAALTITSGTLAGEGPIMVSSNAVFTINSGTLVGVDNTIIYGAAGWSNGTLQGTLTLATNSTLTLAGNNANLLVENCTLTNYGTVLWSSGNPDGGGVPGTVIFNYGLWNCQSDYQFKNDGNGSGTIFNNYGTFSKTGGTNTSSTFFPSGVVFDQLAGQLDLQKGYLNLSGGGNFLAGTATNNGGILTLSGGNFILNGTATGTKVFETGGNLSGTAVLNGGLVWQGGNWNLVPTATILSGSTLTLNGGNNNLSFNNCILTNLGTVRWTNGYPDGGGTSPGTVVYNYGLWDCQSDYSFKDDGGGSNTVFYNYGTLRKSGGASEFTTATYFLSGVTFNQLAGVIDVQNGTNGLLLDFQGGGNFSGGYITTNVFGQTDLGGGGNFNLNGTVTGTNTWEYGGSLVGTNVIHGALVWAGPGNWNGASSVTIAANSALIVAGTGNLYFNDVLITNNGTVTWANGTLSGGNGSTVYNHGLWDCQSDQVFNNYGTLRKSGGVSESTDTFFQSGVVFNQLAGLIDVQNGADGLGLDFQGGGNFTGGYITTNVFGQTIFGAGANFNLNGTVTGTNSWESGGNLVGTNVINGALVWTGPGNWNGASSVTITANSALNVVGSGNSLSLDNCVLTNYGTVIWSSGYPDGGGSTVGTIFDNYGLWLCQSNYNIKNDGGGKNTTFNNYGTFRKTGASGGSSALVSGVTFNNLGKLDSQLGNISLQGAYSLAGGTLNFGLNSSASYGTITLAGAAALTGAVSANLNNGFVPITGNSFAVLTYGSKSGTFTSTALPLGVLWSTNYGSTTYTISVANVLPPGSVTNLTAQWQSGQATLQFNGAPGASYTVLATTNLTVPTTNWIPLGQASQPTSGSFLYLDIMSPAYPQRFYLIHSP